MTEPAVRLHALCRAAARVLPLLAMLCLAVAPAPAAGGVILVMGDSLSSAYGFDVDETLTYPDLVRSFLQQKKVWDDKPIVGATVHKFFDVTQTIWPDARYIHIVRDPRDVARSCVVIGTSAGISMP